MVELPDELKNLGFTFNDVDLEDITLLDGRSNFDFKDIDTSTYFTRRIKGKIPIISSPMDTVTRAELAIALNLQGGLPILDYNFKDPEDQKREAEKVKGFLAGFVEGPVTLGPHDLIDHAARIREEGGPSTIPITENGKPDGRLVGMLTRYDYSMHLHAGLQIRERMTTLENGKLAAIRWSELPQNDGQRVEYANKRLLESRAVALPIVDDDGKLLYLVTRSDIEKHEGFPLATTDRKGRLRLGVAVKTRDEYKDVIKDLVVIGVDALCIDTAHGMNEKYVYPFIEYLKKEHGDIVDIIAGNTGNPEGVRDLIERGVDAVKVGVGVGSACTTAETTGVYVPQGFACYHCSLVGKEYGVPIIGDGGLKRIGNRFEDGIRETGDILKTLALGPNSAMLGGMLAGTEEAPGEVGYDKEGNKLKKYRGMGSLGAMKSGGIERGYNERVPEGADGWVPYVGPLSEHVQKIITALKQGMEKIGARTIDEIYGKAKLIWITEGAKRERKVSLKNYQKDF